jgi:hypothetical protein
MLGVTLIAGSRLRARRRAPAAPSLVAAAAPPTGRWGESRLPAADFDEWHEEDTAPRAAAAVAAPPALEELGERELDDVFAGREPGGRFSQPAPAAPLVPDARSVFGEVVPPRGGAAGFRSAPRRTGVGALLGNPALRAAAYAAAGIALVALVVNLALGGGSEPAAERAISTPAPTVQAPPQGPTPAELAAERQAAATAASDARAAAATLERRARRAERRAIRRRRAAAAKRRREAAAARRNAPAAPQPATPAPAAPPTGGSSGGTPCELGCIG